MQKKVQVLLISILIRSSPFCSAKQLYRVASHTHMQSETIKLTGLELFPRLLEMDYLREAVELFMSERFCVYRSAHLSCCTDS